ncbi:uncharacterized protein LOC5504581 [Nematostella vectensis]|uniref:uncharacterized protein LOC5504581 n=1 Tax=Nematostella vectensis TaxID=45351 RepID=UPI0020773DE1|nr:uncharacterized protein LOC5504581 [Nematostella vectensis]
MGSQQSVASVESSAGGGMFTRIPLADGLKLEHRDTKGLKNFEEGKAFEILAQKAKIMEEKEAKRFMFRPGGASELPERLNVGDRVATLGSQDPIIVTNDVGIFSAIVTAYNMHWNLRTSPEDWWFTVIKKVANAIDDNSKNQAVRDMFVSHEGKKTLEVSVPTLSIYGIDYDWFFGEMSKLIDENIKVPGYVDTMTADFSSTTKVQRIVSQVTLMSSVQEFFEFKCVTRCGIPAIEMLGTEEDWARLLTKAKELRRQLDPIEEVLQLKNWWGTVEAIFEKLLATYKGYPDKKWWSHILSWKKAYRSGQTTGWEGWLMDFLVKPGSCLMESSLPGGLVTVPLIFTAPGGEEDTAALVAGMLGFTVHQEVQADRPSIQSFQGWSLLLPENSPFRKS